MSKELKPEQDKQTSKQKDAAKQAKPVMDFAKLDLAVEKVEERISPNETNVFDK